jgi:hypothetical protein
MKIILTIVFLFGLLLRHVNAQSPSAQTFVYAGYPAIGFDYAKKLNRQKWSSGVVSLAISPGFYFRKYDFDFSSSTSRYTNYRILLPVLMRLEFYPNQILLPDFGKKKGRIGVFLDLGYTASYSLKSHLTENFYASPSSPTSVFSFDGELTSGTGKISFHPTIGFGMKIKHFLFLFRTIIRPYTGKDLSKGWNLPEGKTSYFYSWEYSQPGVMLCIGYTL